MFIARLILFIVIVNYSLQNITDTILNNKELSYANIEAFSKENNITDEPIFNKNENKQITFPSIHYFNFAFYFSVSINKPAKDKTITDESTKGVWLWLLETPFNSTYKEVLNEKEQLYQKYSGIGLKINKNSLIAVGNNNDSIDNVLFSELDNKSNTSKYLFNLTDIKEAKIYIRISLYLKYLYYEISYDGINFNLWFANEFIVSNGNNIHFELIGNFKNEEIDYYINNIYQAQFNGLISKNKNNDKDIINLYEKIERINELMHSFDIYDELTQQLKKYPFEKIIEDNLIQINKVAYINKILGDSLNNNTTTNTTTNTTSNTTNDHQNKFDTLLNLIRNVSLSKSSLEGGDSMSNVLEVLNILKEKQNNMNESIFTMYRTVSQVIENINTKANKMETYKSFEKILLILIVLSLVLLYSIYNNISSSNNDQINNKDKSGKPIVSEGHSQIELV